MERLLTRRKIQLSQNLSWLVYHRNDIVTGDMRLSELMLLEVQRIIERALALHAPIKVCYIRKDKPKFLLQEKWLCEKTKKNSFQELSMMKLKTIYFVKKKNNFSQVLWS